MNPFSTWMLLAGGVVVAAGWVLLLCLVSRLLSRRTRKSPARRHRSTAVAAPRTGVAGAATQLLPRLPAALPRGDGHRAGRAGSPLPPAGPAYSVRLEAAPGWAPRRAPVPGRALERGTRPGTPQLPVEGCRPGPGLRGPSDAPPVAVPAAAAAQTLVLRRVADAPTETWTRVAASTTTR